MQREAKAGAHAAALHLQAEAAAEAKLRGPHVFPLERMLATFWELRAAQDEAPPGAAEQRDAQSGDLFMEISSLVSMRFLSQVTAASPHEPCCACRVMGCCAQSHHAALWEVLDYFGISAPHGYMLHP